MVKFYTVSLFFIIHGNKSHFLKTELCQVPIKKTDKMIKGSHWLLTTNNKAVFNQTKEKLDNIYICHEMGSLIIYFIPHLFIYLFILFSICSNLT